MVRSPTHNTVTGEAGYDGDECDFSVAIEVNIPYSFIKEFIGKRYHLSDEQVVTWLMHGGEQQIGDELAAYIDAAVIRAYMER